MIEFIAKFDIDISSVFKYIYFEFVVGTLNSSTNDLASCVKRSLEPNYIKLKNSYEFHRSGFQEPDSKPFNARDKKPCSPLSDLYMAVHSLDLHLQAALCR